MSLTLHKLLIACFINPWCIHFLLIWKSNPLDFNPGVLKKAAVKKALKVNAVLPEVTASVETYWKSGV